MKSTGGCFIEISIALQVLRVFLNQNLIKSYSISTALNGVGSLKNSGQTPLGRHVIRARIGEGAPMNAVFVGRRLTGEIYSADFAKMYPARDWILTRILWLSGLEIGKNRLGEVDTMQRYIYIHGTPDSEPLGVPLSHGCIRMHSEDVLDLFNRVQVGCLVEILAE